MQDCLSLTVAKPIWYILRKLTNIYLERRYIMKTIFLLLSLVFVSSCVTSGVKTRAVASEGCNLENYQNFIDKPGVHKCDLREANFKKAVFYKTNLDGVKLDHAKMAEADLREADLSGADLRGANLEGGDLRNAILEGADLSNTDLRETRVGIIMVSNPGGHRPKIGLMKYFKEKNFQEADLSHADLTKADMYKAILPEASLIEADLREIRGYKINLSFSILQDANLQGVDLRGAQWERAVLKGAKITKRQAKYLKKQGLSGFVVVE